MVEKPGISPICGKKPAHAEIRVHKICVFLGRMVHTHGRIKGWGKLLKKKPPPFRVTKRVSVPFRKRGFEVKYPERVTVKSNCVRRAYGKGTQKMKSCTVLRLFFYRHLCAILL